MARSTKPRRAYRPRYVAGHMLLPSQRDKIALPAHMALNAIEIGAGKIEHRHTLAASLNIFAALAAKLPNVASETRTAINAGQDALVSADRRFLKSERWGLSGPEMLALRQAVTLGDELLKRANSATLKSLVEWIYQVNDRTPEVLGTADAPLGAPA